MPTTTSTMRRITVGLTSAGLIAGALLLGAGSAQAAGRCGADYDVVRTVNIDTVDGTKRTLSRITVQYNTRNGYWCAVNNNATSNTPSRMSVSIKRLAESYNPDFTKNSTNEDYAGPVYRFRGERACIDVKGSITVNGSSAGDEYEVCR